MGYYNNRQNSTNPMLDNWCNACLTLMKSNHLLSSEDEETIMNIAKKLSHQTRYPL